ncbi:carboxylate-amine ligase [Aliiroseovarius sp. YM-037]|uniref:carboxylate-amine ligase n=1 Tax=Aliiroseovarius sp. YM-037 TaxID=3341728 RepID=UPI003A813396
MSDAVPEFTIGVEEEYLLVDKDSCALANAPEALMNRCKSELEGQVSPEFLNCQIEIGTQVCRNVAEAREDLKNLRSTVARVAAEFNLAPIAASCHPFGDWKDQTHTDRDRYNTLQKDLAGVARRMLICGMHVHVGIDKKDQRIDLMNQLSYFLPHLLALSCSSPFWQGQDTGLSSYRLTVFDNLPRTGLPPKLEGWGAYERSVTALVHLGLMEDSSKIWWDLRPSARFPTIENRICDVSPLLENTLSLAALTQCLTRMLWRLQRLNQRWRLYDNMLISENRWRAQRYGVGEGLIDFGILEIVPFETLLDEMIELVAEDAEAVEAVAEVTGTRSILGSGTSADRQRAVYQEARDNGRDHDDALCAVVRHLQEEFHADL